MTENVQDKSYKMALSRKKGDMLKKKKKKDIFTQYLSPRKKPIFKIMNRPILKIMYSIVKKG